MLLSAPTAPLSSVSWYWVVVKVAIFSGELIEERADYGYRCLSYATCTFEPLFIE